MTHPSPLRQAAPLATLAWSEYLDQLEKCDGIAAFEGTPTEPVPSHMINSGDWEGIGGGIMFHVAYSADPAKETFPATPAPSPSTGRLVFFLAGLAAIIGAWLGMGCFDAAWSVWR